LDSVVIRLSRYEEGSEEALQRLRDALALDAGRAIAARLPLLDGIAEGLKLWREALFLSGTPSGVGAWIAREIDFRFPALAQLAALDEKGGTS
jgi:hypothetical protein